MRHTTRVCILFTLVLYTITQEIGERCTLKNGTQGTCEDIAKCTSAIQDLRKRKLPVQCGFIGYISIVCCANKTTTKISTGSNTSTAIKGSTSTSTDTVGNVRVLETGVTPRISEKKCQEYRVLHMSPVLGGGGVDAQPNEFSHMAILGYNSDNGTVVYKCGGSLISDQFVLTAAHCLESRELGEVSSVRIGDLDTTSDKDDAKPQDFTVIERIPHPDYDFEQFYHDLALIKLDRKVQITKYVRPACLQSDLKLENNYLTATGWGALYFGGDMHNKLQKLNISSLSKEKCLPTYRPQPRLKNGIDEDLQICGGNLERSVDTCHGDSGGPLQLKIQSYPPVHRVVGVTSFGVNCNLVPGIYTRVSSYISWIENVVWPS